MAYEEKLSCISLRAPSTALSGYQFRLVKAGTTEGTFIAGSTKAAGTRVSAVGVLQDAPTVSGEACAIATFNGGISKIVCGSTKLSASKNFIMGVLGKAQSTASAVAQDYIYGPWLAAAGSTDSVGQGCMNILGITT